MAHNIDMTNDRANIAFIGDRRDIWHRMGQAMAPGQSIEEWAKAAGLDWNAIKVPAIAALPSGEMRRVEGQSFLVRDDNGAPLGYVSGETEKQGYQTVQPGACLEWFRDYIKHDDRFQLDCAGSLKGGRLVWATALFNGPIDVAGDKHKARLLMTTSFDGTQATINQATMTRVVCNNTLRVATADKRAMIRRTAMTLNTRDIGLAIRDFIEDRAIIHYEGDEERGEPHGVAFVDASDANNLHLHMASGEVFTVRIIAGAR